MSESDLYFEQLPVGQMANFAYLVGSRSSRECYVVDPAWSVDALLDRAETDGIPGSFDQLRIAVAGVQTDPGKPTDPDTLALAWAVAHGVASLISDGMWKKNDPRVAAALRLSFKGIAPGK